VAVQQGLVVTGTGLTQRRLRSRACAIADLVVAAAGASLLALAALDSVVSWPSNHVLVDDRQLSRVAGILLGPGWPWLLVSYATVFGIRNRRRSRSQRPTRWPVPLPLLARVGLAVTAALCIAVIAGGFAVGAAKGNARILPGPRYEVSTLDLNQADWTLVPKRQYDLWQARFVREDGLFMLFGFALAAGSLGLFQLHLTARRASQD
jgi:hypothetical protein